MDEKTRQLVLNLLAKAHGAALRAVQAELDKLPTEDRNATARAIQEFRECLQNRFEEQAPLEDSTARIASLIHGHPNPQAVGVMREYAELVQVMLVESRNGLLSAGNSRRSH